MNTSSLLLLLASACLQMQAQTYSFTKVAEWPDAARQLPIGLSLSDRGEIAFTVVTTAPKLDGPPFLEYKWQSYVYSEGALRQIGNLDQPTMVADISANGKILYAEKKTSGSYKLLLDHNGEVTEVDDLENGPLATINGGSVNDDGDVTFFAIKDTGILGVYVRTASGELQTILEEPTHLAPFLNLGVRPRLNNRRSVAVSLGPAGGLMLARDGNVQAIPAPLEVAGLVREYGISLNSDDTVAFATRSVAPAGSMIYRSKGGAAPEPVIARPVLDLWAVTINDGGAIAFVEQSLSTQLPIIGLISALRVLPTNSTTPVKVIQTGDALFGSTVSILQVLERASAFKYLNNSGVVAFHYGLANGATGIAFASPQ